jgi:uncharacterized protein YhaN
MRIHRIDLAAYGRFTDASLVFGPADKRVYLVYGPNEAGKSTLLRAIWRFFYGDLRKSTDDYLHPVSNMRIGMTLELPSGEVVKWTRRGGGSQSLRDEADAPVAAMVMQRLLSDVNEDAFQKQFAINHPQLRTGGEELHQENGELGAALFSAATGLSSVGRIANELEKEADESFKARGSAPPINRAISRIKELKDSLRKSSVSTAKYTEMVALRNEAAARVQAIQGERSACQDRKWRLQQIVAAIPKVVRLSALIEELERLPPTPSLGPDFGKRRQEATNGRERLGALIGQNERRINTLKESLAHVRPDPRAVELLPLLQSLEKKTGSFEKAQADRARLEVEIAKSERDVTEKRRSLSGPQESAHAPPRHDLLHFRTRLESYKKLSGNLHSLEREVSRIDAQLAMFEERANGSVDEVDLQPLKSALAGAQLHSTIDKDLEKLVLQIAQLSQSTEAELRSLAITVQADEFVTLELPQAATIAEFDRKFARLEKQVDETQRRIKELTDSRNDLAHRLGAMLSNGQVPTEREVAQARTRRDELWLEIRSSLDAPPRASKGKTPLLQKLDDDRASQFEVALREADRLADLLRSEAHRIAERLKLEADQSVAIANLEVAEMDYAKLEGERESFDTHWREFASRAPTSLRMPSELKEWQPAALRLQDQLRKLANLKLEKKQQVALAHRLVQALTAAGAALGAPFQGELLVSILPLAQDHLQQFESEQSRRYAAAEQFAQLRTRQRESRGEMEGARRDAAAAWTELKVTAANWCWGDIQDAHELDRLVPLMDDLERLDAEMREKKHRVEGIDRDAAELRSLVAGIAEKLNLKASDDSIEAMLATVSARLEETRGRVEQSRSLQNEIRELERTLEEQRQSLALAESDLRALVLEAAADSLEALPYIEAAVQKRSVLEAEKKSLEDQLDALTENQSREAFIAACQATEITSARSEILELQAKTEELEALLDVQREELRTHDAWLRSNPTLEKVANEELQLQGTLGELSALVREHVKTRLAAEVLHRSMQRYRDENQSELLKAGGEIFSRLSNGAYSGIRSEISNDGVAELLAARGDKSTVPLACLSDGALDRLYLALRIATLERHFLHHPPMPFIVDDIFVMFDDDVTLAALQELARVSETTQVIIFTHHSHVVELALNGLGDRCVTHELTQTGPFRTSALIHEAHTPAPIPARNNASLTVSTPRKRPKKTLAGE